jgi:ADP-ribosylglycohydrolase
MEKGRMAALTLPLETYKDKVYGGWLGKSVGLTLGANLRGQLTPSYLQFYNPVPGQPVASIALDFPLVWLDTLEQYGSFIGSEDLALAWLEHLDYTQEELGYASMNLQRGLPPPASGAHSNWFKDGTLGTMRSDFWAMIAPGAPQIAAAYAFQDATIDHAEEGEWAAMFLSAIGSASFFISDIFPLLTIGLAMIPRTCRTARAVKAVLAAGQKGASWLEARERVLIEVGSKNFSDVAQNIGFITIGLLYGSDDFGTSLTAAVNCGYDTEAVGAALGALMGIRHGASRLPQDWTRPIGDILIPGMGLKQMVAPLQLSHLAERTVAVGQRVVQERGIALAFEEPKPEPTPEPLPETLPEPEPAPLAELSPEETPTVPDVQEAMAQSEPVFEASVTPEPEPTPISEEPPAPPHILDAIAWADNTLVKPLLVLNPNAQCHTTPDFRIVFVGGDSPILSYGQYKAVAVQVENLSDTPFVGTISLLAPTGWQVTTPQGLGQRQYMAAKTGTFQGQFGILVPEGAGRIEIANSVRLRFTPEQGEPFEAEFLLLGASCWWTVGPFGNFDGEGFDRTYMPEERSGLHESYIARTMQQVRWERHTFAESVLDLEPIFRNSSGVCYGQTILSCPENRLARLVANTNSGVKIWLNGKLVFRRHHREIFRPLLGSGSWAADVDLQAGDNLLLVKWVRGNEPISFSLTWSDREGHPLPEVGNTRWSS